ncbi:transglutaminase-like domain-containing protein [Fulvivirga ligni]|uniref:transglutaminase-like domain-containing protein n=1 Tax=Fulvivirga ligni TaxID=2904246 RepID=UPI001F251CD1|nr:transglutaminase domain-containing protein [Fulvivirga ligni]UII24178.1 transglutaminase domain-containing protein [Fulvivirga ligni]
MFYTCLAFRIKAIFLLFIASTACLAQKIDPERIKQAKDIAVDYEDASVAAITSFQNFTFFLDKRENSLRVKNEELERLIALKDGEKFIKRIFYNDKIELNHSAVLNEKGRSYDHNKFCGHYQSGDIFYSDAQICAFRMHMGQQGQIVDFEATTTYLDPKYLTYVFFHEETPVLKKEIVFEIPVGVDVELKEMNFEGYNITKKTVGNKYIFTVNQLEPIKENSNDPGHLHYLPHILILTKSFKASDGSKVPVLASTNDLYKWYHHLTLNLDNKPSELKQKVAEIIQDKQTDDEKIKAIYYWVQDNIKYIAFENGLAGFQPDPASKVFYNKYGDCKGMANLTKEMLKLAGYDARLTWIGTNKIPYTYDIPTLAVDNHMVCTVFLNGKKFILDSTEKYNPMGFNAERIQGKQVLIEDGDNYIIEKVDEQPIEDYLVENSWDYTVNENQLQGSGSVKVRGEYKKVLLNYINTVDKSDKDKFLKAVVSGDSEPDYFSISDYTGLDRKSPTLVNYDMNLANQVSSFGAEMYLDIDFNDDYKGSLIEDDRKVPYSFGSKKFSKTTAKLSIPDGYKVEYLPEPFQMANDYYSFTAKYEVQQGRILYTKEIKLFKTILPTDGFGQWNETIKDLTKFYDDQIILKREN